MGGVLANPLSRAAAPWRINRTIKMRHSIVPRLKGLNEAAQSSAMHTFKVEAGKAAGHCSARLLHFRCCHDEFGGPYALLEYRTGEGRSGISWAAQECRRAQAKVGCMRYWTPD